MEGDAQPQRPAALQGRRKEHEADDKLKAKNLAGQSDHISGPSKRVTALTGGRALKLLQILENDLEETSARIHAASLLHQIAEALGPSRVKNELLPFLQDIIEGPPNFPLLPPVVVESEFENGADAAGHGDSTRPSGLAIVDDDLNCQVHRNQNFTGVANSLSSSLFGNEIGAGNGSQGTRDDARSPMSFDGVGYSPGGSAVPGRLTDGSGGSKSFGDGTPREDVDRFETSTASRLSSSGLSPETATRLGVSHVVPHAFSLQSRPKAALLAASPNARLFLSKVVISTARHDEIKEAILKGLKGSQLVVKSFGIGSTAEGAQPPPVGETAGMVTTLIEFFEMASGCADSKVRQVAIEEFELLIRAVPKATLINSVVGVLVRMSQSANCYKLASVVSLLLSLLELLYHDGEGKGESGSLIAHLLGILLAIPIREKSAVTRYTFAQQFARLMALVARIDREPSFKDCFSYASFSNLYMEDLYPSSLLLSAATEDQNPTDSQLKRLVASVLTTDAPTSTDLSIGAAAGAGAGADGGALPGGDSGNENGNGNGNGGANCSQRSESAFPSQSSLPSQNSPLFDWDRDELKEPLYIDPYYRSVGAASLAFESTTVSFRGSDSDYNPGNDSALRSEEPRSSVSIRNAAVKRLGDSLSDLHRVLLEILICYAQETNASIRVCLLKMLVALSLSFVVETKDASTAPLGRLSFLLEMGGDSSADTDLLHRITRSYWPKTANTAPAAMKAKENVAPRARSLQLAEGFLTNKLSHLKLKEHRSGSEATGAAKAFRVPKASETERLNLTKRGPVFSPSAQRSSSESERCCVCDFAWAKSARMKNHLEPCGKMTPIIEPFCKLARNAYPSTSRSGEPEDLSDNDRVRQFFEFVVIPIFLQVSTPARPLSHALSAAMIYKEAVADLLPVLFAIVLPELPKAKQMGFLRRLWLIHFEIDQPPEPAHLFITHLPYHLLSFFVLHPESQSSTMPDMSLESSSSRLSVLLTDIVPRMLQHLKRSCYSNAGESIFAWARVLPATLYILTCIATALLTDLRSSANGVLPVHTRVQAETASSSERTALEIATAIKTGVTEAYAIILSDSNHALRLTAIGSFQVLANVAVEANVTTKSTSVPDAVEAWRSLAEDIRQGIRPHVAEAFGTTLTAAVFANVALDASTIGVPNSPTTVPLWRVKCFALHLFQTLAPLFFLQLTLTSQTEESRYDSAPLLVWVPLGGVGLESTKSSRALAPSFVSNTRSEFYPSYQRSLDSTQESFDSSDPSAGEPAALRHEGRQGGRHDGGGASATAKGLVSSLQACLVDGNAAVRKCAAKTLMRFVLGDVSSLKLLKRLLQPLFDRADELVANASARRKEGAVKAAAASATSPSGPLTPAERSAVINIARHYLLHRGDSKSNSDESQARLRVDEEGDEIERMKIFDEFDASIRSLLNLTLPSPFHVKEAQALLDCFARRIQ